MGVCSDRLKKGSYARVRLKKGVLGTGLDKKGGGGIYRGTYMSLYKLNTSHDVPQSCAMIVRRRVIVMRWSCVKL